ncbi:hypothetical protein BGX28_006831 [Mortierella sp. GBA30]|nr:hypothetical protein BGX28_006831 [Mortierella sp. GBA30]
MAIEIRLTLKFSLLGANSFEETQILGFFSSSRSLMHRQEDAYYSRSQVRDEERDTFIKTKLPVWMSSPKKALKRTEALIITLATSDAGRDQDCSCDRAVVERAVYVQGLQRQRGADHSRVDA